MAYINGSVFLGDTDTIEFIHNPGEHFPVSIRFGAVSVHIREREMDKLLAAFNEFHHKINAEKIADAPEMEFAPEDAEPAGESYPHTDGLTCA